MTGNRNQECLTSLVHELCALPRETKWAGFEVRDAEQKLISEYISALANAAALAGCA